MATMKDQAAIFPVASAAGSDLSDESLLVQYRETDDRSFFETLIHRYETEIFCYLRRYVGDSDTAEEAFQGTFLQVHLKCDQFDATRRFRPWLYGIATNQAIDAQRRNKRHRMASLDRTSLNSNDDRSGSWAEKLVGDAPDPYVVAAREENGRWINKSVADLGETMQQVVNLVYYQGLKYREAAEILGIPVGTVKSRLHVAIQRLSTLWEETHQSSDE